LHGDNTKNLGMAEQFFVEMMKIDRYEQRLKAMYFKRRFDERVEEVVPVRFLLQNSIQYILREKKSINLFREPMQFILVVKKWRIVQN